MAGAEFQHGILSEDAAESVWERQALSQLVGAAPGFRAAVERLRSFARSDATVLVTGETGTGKELAARAIHYRSARAPCPFVAVNCGSLPDSLLEAELFGHARGAFTDARSARRGLIAEADRGTLFLDEVDSLSPRAQAALLRVLQDGTYRTLGGNVEHSTSARVVAATNAPLIERVREGTFRADLYYRLGVLLIELPPLRERRGDVLPLARHFIQKHAFADGVPPRLSPIAEGALLAYDWPGNVRELENVIVRALHLCRAGAIEPEHLRLPDPVPQRAPLPVSLDVFGGERSFQELKHEVVRAFEREYLTRLMSTHHGNVSRAARTAGKERRELGKLLKKHDLDPRDFSAPSLH